MANPPERALHGLKTVTWSIHHSPPEHNTPDSDIASLRVAGANPEDARLLRDGLGASAGELAAISQYMYHFALFPLPLQHAIMAIAQSEMHHLHLFATAIVLLGADPMYADRDGRPFSTSLITYNKVVPEMLQTDLDSEQAAIQLYREIQGKLSDANLKIMLERIIADEQGHATVFRRAALTYQATGGEPLDIDVCYCPYTDEPDALYCGPEQSPRPDLDPTLGRSLLTDLAGANSHYTEATQYYYQAFVSGDDPWLRNTLFSIALEENHHIHQTQLVIRWIGMDPVFCDSSGRYWVATFLNYSRDPAQFLQTDIALEQGRIASLAEKLTQTDDQFVRRQLEAMLEEERRHLEMFRTAAARYAESKPKK